MAGLNTNMDLTDLTDKQVQIPLIEANPEKPCRYIKTTELPSVKWKPLEVLGKAKVQKPEQFS